MNVICGPFVNTILEFFFLRGLNINKRSETQTFGNGLKRNSIEKWRKKCGGWKESIGLKILFKWQHSVSSNDWEHNYESAKGLLLTIPVGCPMPERMCTKIIFIYKLCVYPSQISLNYIQPTGGLFSGISIFEHIEFPLFCFLYSLSFLEKGPMRPLLLERMNKWQIPTKIK